MLLGSAQLHTVFKAAKNQTYPDIAGHEERQVPRTVGGNKDGTLRLQRHGQCKRSTVGVGLRPGILTARYNRAVKKKNTSLAQVSGMLIIIGIIGL